MSDEHTDTSASPAAQESRATEDTPKKSAKKGISRKNRHSRPPIHISEREVQARFVACGRCGAFFAGYRALHGAQHVSEAIQASDDGWLTLHWDKETRYLLYKSYGTRYEEDVIGFERMCQDCGRRFNYREEEEEQVEEQFRMEIKLR